MKWFSISGIISETKKIQWPKGKDLARDSMTVFLFTFFLGVFFFLCQIVTSGFLKVIGM